MGKNILNMWEVWECRTFYNILLVFIFLN